MENILSRYRNLTILVTVLFAQVLGLAFQVRRPGEEGKVRLVRVWVVAVIAPVEKAVVNSGNFFGEAWRKYVWLRGAREENERLKSEMTRLRLEQVRLAQDAAQAQRLQVLLAFKEQFVSETVAAQVIGTSGSETSRIVYIDKGEGAGIKADMAVITSEGVVGKVLKVFRGTSQVLLISDPSSGVGAILEKSRLQGIVKGSASGEVVLHYVMSDEKVVSGDVVLTSGGDRIFPKGLPIGVVSQVSSGQDLFLNIRVKPAAHIGRLEEVLVITRITEKQPTAAQTASIPSGPVRAADILAQRLPGVKAKGPDGAAQPSTGIPPTTAELLRMERERAKGANRATGVPPTTQELYGRPAPAKPATQPAQPGTTAATPVQKPASSATPASPKPDSQKTPASGQRPAGDSQKAPANGQRPAAPTTSTPAPATPPPANPPQGRN